MSASRLPPDVGGGRSISRIAWSRKIPILFSDSGDAGESEEEVTGLDRAFSNVFLYADLLRLGKFDVTPHRDL